MTVFIREKLKKFTIATAGTVAACACILGSQGIATADDTPAPDPGAPIIRAAAGPGIAIGTPGGDTVTVDKGVAIGNASAGAPIVISTGNISKPGSVGGGVACGFAVSKMLTC